MGVIRYKGRDVNLLQWVSDKINQNKQMNIINLCLNILHNSSVNLSVLVFTRSAREEIR